jgi:CHAT domain-containing protein
VGRPPPTAKAGDLPGAGDEVRYLAGLFGTQPYLGPQASETVVRSHLGDAAYVHIACHGKADEARPMYSYLSLAADEKEDGTLHAYELMGLRFRGRLVVLSACETGHGEVVRGEGVLGLAWALFVARAPSSIVTQWRVDQDSTPLLMKAFYRELRPAGPTWAGKIGKARALQQAQLQLLQNKKYRHPFYWAPFVLIGEWGK